MKQLLATFALAALSVTAAHAQAVLGYSASLSQGAYTPLENPTTVFDGSVSDTDGWSFPRYVIGLDGSGNPAIIEDGDSAPGMPIGFDFDFCGKTYTSFLVNPTGYIYLGGSEPISFNPYMGQNFMTYGGDMYIVGVANSNGVGGDTDTRVSYKQLGSGNDTRLVIEFKHLLLESVENYEKVPMDFQLVLYKDGRVENIYSGFSGIAAVGDRLSVGMALRAGKDFVCTSGEGSEMYLSRNARTSYTFASGAADGVTFSLDVPEDCVTPAAQPTDLKLTSTTTEINGSFTPCEGADTYLAVYAEAGKTLAVPADGTVYSAGEDFGEGKVAYVGGGTEFELYGLAGSTDYDFRVYAVGSYGYNGPKYNTVSPLTGTINTKPLPVEDVEFSDTSLDSFSLKVTPNVVDDEIVVIYNSYCERSSFGDHGLFGDIPADVKAGDVLPVPEGYENAWKDYQGMTEPENAGTVAYVGKAGGDIAFSGLAANTLYYVGVYTRNAKGEFTSEPLYTGWSTYMENPYDGNTIMFPRYCMPYGWESSEDGENTFSFRDESFTSFTSEGPSQGTQYIQQSARISKGDAINGKEGWVIPMDIDVKDRHVMARFDYCLVSSPDRFSTTPYNDWAEGDILEVRVSEDNGQTWVPLTSYTDADHPRQEELYSYVSISGDLSDYRGKTVKVQLYWKTFNNAAFGSKMFIDRFSVLQAEFPEVPEVFVGKITDNSAVVAWTSRQTDYELSYKVKGGDVTHIVEVKNAKTYTLEGLEANTEYEVLVRGVLVDEATGEQTGFSEWSDPVCFTTGDYPAVDAPQNVTADTDTFAAVGYVRVAWDKVDEALKYEVAYRLSSATEWTYAETGETSYILTDLKGGENYVVKVRAFCTHDRETAYSAQVRFTAPETVGIEGVDADAVSVTGGHGCIAVTGAGASTAVVCDANGAVVASGEPRARYEVAPGLYIVAIGNRTFKVVVK